MHFLALPREIRDLIYERLLETHRPPLDLDRRVDESNEATESEARVVNERKARPPLQSLNDGKFCPTISCLPAMRTCRQLYHEITQKLELMKDLTAILMVPLGPYTSQKMDLVQWYSVPSPFRYIKHVEVHFRLATRTWVTTEAELRDNFVGQGAPGLVVQWWLYILAGFALHGPGIEHKRKYHANRSPLDTLTLVFKSPKGLTFKPLASQISGSTNVEDTSERRILAIPYFRTYGWFRQVGTRGILGGVVRTCNMAAPALGEFDQMPVERTTDSTTWHWGPYGWVMGLRNPCCKLPIFVDTAS